MTEAAYLKSLTQKWRERLRLSGNLPPRDAKLEVVTYKKDGLYSVYVKRAAEPQEPGAPLGIFCCLPPTKDQDMAVITASAYRSLIETKRGRGFVLEREQRGNTSYQTYVDRREGL